MKLFYFSRPDCGVCKTLRPKIETMVREEFPLMEFKYFDLDEQPELAGEYSIFTIPAILVFFNDKETIREARYVSVEALEDSIRRYYDMLTT
jgi:thioredoxin 1